MVAKGPEGSAPGTPLSAIAPTDLWLARGAVVCVAGLQLLLVNDFTVGPRWFAPALEMALLLALSVATVVAQARLSRATVEARHRHEAHRRQLHVVALGLTALIMAVNAAALFRLVDALLATPGRFAGRTLLIDAVNLWITNIVVFALWFWNLDRGGPTYVGREPIDDFQFPQMAMPGGDRWQPGFVDYLYLAFTNATAFSPTDTMPLTARAKLLMMVEALISLLTLSLVTARAVNILT